MPITIVVQNEFVTKKITKPVHVRNGQKTCLQWFKNRLKIEIYVLAPGRGVFIHARTQYKQLCGRPTQYAPLLQVDL